MKKCDTLTCFNNYYIFIRKWYMGFRVLKLTAAPPYFHAFKMSLGGSLRISRWWGVVDYRWFYFSFSHLHLAPPPISGSFQQICWDLQILWLLFCYHRAGALGSSFCSLFSVMWFFFLLLVLCLLFVDCEGSDLIFL